MVMNKNCSGPNLRNIQNLGGIIHLVVEYSVLFRLSRMFGNFYGQNILLLVE